MNDAQILVLDDEGNIRKILKAMLVAEGHHPSTASFLAEAKEHIRTKDIQVILTDLRLEREDGLSLLKWLREEGFNIPVIILTAHGSIDSAVDAMKQGAFDYLSKPFDRQELLRVIEKALLTHKFNRQNNLKTSEGNLLVGNSPLTQKALHLVERVAAADTTVLISGESGTGKELIAQSIHERSNRNTGPFIKINCAAIPESLLESELFGYEKGAFTGAQSTKPGRFELAHKGTLFLDEIGEMSPEMQVKLLRVLQERSFERVGGIKTIQVDVRLVAATNKDLEAEVKNGRFRSDLFYRLNVVPIHLAPLRERREDIPLLVAHFSRKLSTRLKRDNPQFSAETLELLMQFPWPGNIRQLENVVERCLIMAEGPMIHPEQLPEEILDYEEEQFIERQASLGGGLRERVKDATRRIEKKAIEEALAETHQNVTQAARVLNLSRKGLQLKMKEL
ncbi:MAG: sigma-54-dependent Fis family transcriptional regulator, partial [Proteobacteria bacterium]|nr:sigma-54-dependent Fis family transcriptional regulator [Pseudomonadota bacterium]NDD05546.1 sigma-54-dependent Fis family transcriptional regulator [Pseudomonadota bacterium]